MLNYRLSRYCSLGAARDPRNDIGLIKLNWPPIGHEIHDNAFKERTRGTPKDVKRKMRRYQRISYRESISTPICLTYDTLDLIDEAAVASVSGTLK